MMAEAGAGAQRVAECRQQILDAARAMAEADGWAAVTSRRLAIAELAARFAS
jgi:AcrR family transcriptional regulator